MWVAMSVGGIQILIGKMCIQYFAIDNIQKTLIEGN